MVWWQLWQRFYTIEMLTELHLWMLTAVTAVFLIYYSIFESLQHCNVFICNVNSADSILLKWSCPTFNRIQQCIPIELHSYSSDSGFSKVSLDICCNCIAFQLHCFHFHTAVTAVFRRYHWILVAIALHSIYIAIHAHCNAFRLQCQLHCIPFVLHSNCIAFQLYCIPIALQSNCIALHSNGNATAFQCADTPCWSLYHESAM